MEDQGHIIFPVNVAVTGCNASVQQETTLKLEYQSPAKPLQDISLFRLSCLRVTRPRAAAHAEGSAGIKYIKKR